MAVSTARAEPNSNSPSFASALGIYWESFVCPRDATPLALARDRRLAWPNTTHKGILMAAITHDELIGYHHEADSEPPPSRPQEQYWRGGRDTVLLAWGVTALIIAGFMLCAAAASAPSAAATSTSAAP
jgi:hypothetical protein